MQELPPAAAVLPALQVAQQAQQPSSAAGAGGGHWEAAAQLRRASEKALNMPTPPATTPGPEDARPMPFNDPGARAVLRGCLHARSQCVQGNPGMTCAACASIPVALVPDQCSIARAVLLVANSSPVARNIMYPCQEQPNIA